MSEDTKEYVLRPGRKHTVIKNGERVTLTGDGKASVKLTEAQAANFQDKVFASGTDKAVIEDSFKSHEEETSPAGTITTPEKELASEEKKANEGGDSSKNTPANKS
jgi:hypothetical protein